MSSDDVREVGDMMNADREKIRELRAIAAALLASLEELYPHAERAVRRLNEQMVGSLYPAINLAMLERATQAIAQAKGV